MDHPLSTTSPRFLPKPEGGEAPTVVWEFGCARPALSSASVGGGLRAIDWVLNIGVPLKYSRTDLADHAAEIAMAAGLRGDGAALFTAADTTRIQYEESDGLRVDTTVGISKPTWAADDDGVFTDWSNGAKTSETTTHGPGTINIVIQLPLVLAEAAAVNAVITVTEAKTQALVEAGIPGTGTASDAIVICWAQSPNQDNARANSKADDAEAVAFMGPRSEWGSRLARAVRDTVAAGITASG